MCVWRRTGLDPNHQMRTVKLTKVTAHAHKRYDGFSCIILFIVFRIKVVLPNLSMVPTGA